MAARKKPAHLRSPNSRPLPIELVTSLPSSTPPARASWDKAIVDEWEVFWSSEIAGPMTATDVPALTRLFDLRNERAALQVALDESDYLTVGSTGQLVSNPLLKVIADLDGRILALEDRFFLNANARLKAGVKTAQASSAVARANATVAKARKPRPDPRLAEVIDVDDAADA